MFMIIRLQGTINNTLGFINITIFLLKILIRVKMKKCYRIGPDKFDLRKRDLTSRFRGENIIAVLRHDNNCTPE